MTAERPAKGVLKEQVPQIEANPIGVSPETVLSAATLLQRKSEEKALTKNDTTPLVQAAADDLRREGIAVTNQDIQSASQSLAESPSGSISQNKTLEIPPKESQAPLPIDVGEYLKAVDDVFRTYQVGKGKWWLMSGIYAGNRAVSNILGGFIARANQREPVWIRAAKGVVEAAKQAGITQGGQLTLANLKNIATNK